MSLHFGRQTDREKTKKEKKREKGRRAIFIAPFGRGMLQIVAASLNRELRKWGDIRERSCLQLDVAGSEVG